MLWHKRHCPFSLLETLKCTEEGSRDETSRWTEQTCELQCFWWWEGCPLHMTLMPAALCGCTQWQQRGFIKNSCCDQCLSVPYGLASKSVEMLMSCNVRASVQKYMTTAPKYIFWDTLHHQLLLLWKSLCSSRLVCQVCYVCSSNWPRMATISPCTTERVDVPLFVVSHKGLLGLHWYR